VSAGRPAVAGRFPGGRAATGAGHVRRDCDYLVWALRQRRSN